MAGRKIIIKTYTTLRQKQIEMGIINVKLNLGGKLLFKCNYLAIEPYAPNTSRKFNFKGVKANVKDINLLKEKKIPLYREDIKVTASILSKIKKWKVISEFEIGVLDYKDLIENEWWVSGLIKNHNHEEYRQGVIDVFNKWQNGETFEWFKLPLNSPLKEDYIYACLLYAGVSSEIIEKEYYKIDLSLVKEEIDFLFLISLEFAGDRSYFGHDLHSFGLMDFALEDSSPADCIHHVHLAYEKTGKEFYKKSGLIFIEIPKPARPVRRVYKDRKGIKNRCGQMVLCIEEHEPVKENSINFKYTDIFKAI